MRRFTTWRGFVGGIVAGFDGYVAVVAAPPGTSRPEAARPRQGRPCPPSVVPFRAATLDIDVVEVGTDGTADRPELFHPEPTIIQGLMLFPVGPRLWSLDLFAGPDARAKPVLELSEGGSFISGVRVAGGATSGLELTAAVRDVAGEPVMVGIRPPRTGQGVIVTNAPWTAPVPRSLPNPGFAGLPGMTCGTFVDDHCFVPLERSVLVASRVGDSPGPQERWGWRNVTPSFRGHLDSARRAEALWGAARPGAAPGTPRLLLRGTDDNDVPRWLEVAPTSTVATPLSGVGTMEPRVGGGRLYGLAGRAEETVLRELGLAGIPRGDRPPIRLQHVKVQGVLPVDDQTVVLVREGDTLKLELFNRLGSRVASRTIGQGPPMAPLLLVRDHVACLWQGGSAIRLDWVQLKEQ